MNAAEPNWGDEDMGDAINRYLLMFEPATYSMQIPPILAKAMEREGLVQWIPPQFGTQMWAITEKGRAEAAKLNG